MHECQVCCRFGVREVRDVYIGYSAKEIGDVAHLDYCGPLSNNKHFPAMIDAASRWLMVKRASGPHAKAAVEALTEWTKHFPLRRIFSDNGRAFTSNRTRDWCQRRRIRQTFAPTCSPSANGLAEFAVGKVLERLRRSGGGQNWHLRLQWAAKEINRRYCQLEQLQNFLQRKEIEKEDSSPHKSGKNTCKDHGCTGMH